MKTIEIVVSPTGVTTVQTKGFSGTSCHDASLLVEQALGVRTAEEQTSEFYQTGTARETAQEKA